MIRAMEHLFHTKIPVHKEKSTMASATTTKMTSSKVTVLKTRSPKAAPVATPEQREAQEAFVNAQLAQDRLAQVKAEQKRIQAELKELKASQPNKLEREIASRPNTPTRRSFSRYGLRCVAGFCTAVRGRGHRRDCGAVPHDSGSHHAEDRVRKMPPPPNRMKAE
jgi:hypothetical protein